jgi:methylenetetrahydrofolate reductase (NADPH)
VISPAVQCPKAMTYGPCGGVRDDGDCEIAPTPCVFLDRVPVRWQRATPEPTRRVGVGEVLLQRARQGALVVTGLPAAPMDSASLRACARELSGAVDAVLMGDSGRERVQFPPSYRARIVADEGLVPWPGLTCRDRNRVALEGELAALADLGVGGVHCVTGDHTRTGHRPDAAPVFDLESTELVALARERGLTTSVAESPASPPVADRPARVAIKARAGADLCFLQYCGEVEDVERFVAGVRREGSGVSVLPGVPVVADREGAELLASFASAVLPAGYVERVLASSDPEEAGVAGAVAQARALLATGVVGGVVLAGAPARGSEVRFARALAQVAQELGDLTAAADPPRG